MNPTAQLDNDEVNRIPADMFQTMHTHWTEEVLQHPHACDITLNNACRDSGMSGCITKDKSDFRVLIESINNAKIDSINNQFNWKESELHVGACQTHPEMFEASNFQH